MKEKTCKDRKKERKYKNKIRELHLFSTLRSERCFFLYEKENE